MTRLIPLLLLAGCGFASAEHSPGEDAGLASPEATRVEVVRVAPTEATVDIGLPGEVIGSKDVVLAASSGGRIERIHVNRGQDVKKGQAIAKVDASIAGAQLAQAEARAEQAASELRRTEALGDLASQAQIDNARINSKIADAALQQAQAAYARAALNAPFAGTVADVFVEEGAHAAPGSPIARIVMLDPIRVTLSVADRDVVTLKQGMPVEVQVNARSGVFEGEVSHIGAAADLRTRAFPVEVKLPNPDRSLLPGMIAQVRVHQDVASDAVVVPQDWIVTKRTEQGVFLEREGTAVWSPVVLGDIAGDQVIIASGVELGDRVVITGHRELKDGEALLVARTGTCCTDGRPTWGD